VGRHPEVPRSTAGTSRAKAAPRVVGQPVELVKVFAQLAFELVRVSDDRR
jgi:hypothetical protein